jgi:hypothetical protein
MSSLNPGKRQQIQNALDRFVAGTATKQDFDNFRDRNLMYCATGNQACQFIAAIPRQTKGVPVDVMYVWAETLRLRWLHSRRDRKEAAIIWQGDDGTRCEPGAVFQAGGWSDEHHQAEAEEALTPPSSAATRAATRGAGSGEGGGEEARRGGGGRQRAKAARGGVNEDGGAR